MARPQPEPSQGHSGQHRRARPPPSSSLKPLPDQAPGCTTTAHLPHPLWDPTGLLPPLGDWQVGAPSVLSPGPTHPRRHGRFSDGREVGHSWCRVVGYEVRGSGGPRSALGSCSRKAHQEGRQGHAVQGREWEETGHGEGRQGRLPVTWRHRPRCPLRRSCRPPRSSGHPCLVSAPFSSSRT